MDDIIDDVIDLLIPCTFCGWIGWTHWPCGSCHKISEDNKPTIIEGLTNQNVSSESDIEKKKAFFKNNYVSTRPKTTTNKQKKVLILDTSEGIQTVAMTDSSVIDVSPGAASGTGNMINLEITLNKPIQIDHRSDVFLDFISGSGLRHGEISNTMVLFGGDYKGLEETADGTNFSISQWPFAFTDESVNTLDIKELKINNNGNVKGTISSNQVDIDNKLCFSTNGSSSSYLTREVTSTYSTNKYNYITTILPTRIKKFTLELKNINRDAYLRRTGSNPTSNIFAAQAARKGRVAFELVFIPV